MKTVLKTLALFTAIAACLAPAALADEGGANWLGAMQAETAASRAAMAAPGVEEWKKPIPISFAIDYTMVSDYVWRGINLSEFDGEGGERPNHQLTVSSEVNLGPYGRVGGSVWFEWFAGQPQITDWTDSHLQEVDYAVYYGYNIEPLGINAEIGYLWYAFPPYRSVPDASSDAASTQELYTKLSFDDGLWWRSLGFKDVKSPIFNPYILYAFDMDLAPSGSYGEFGISHPFALKECGMGETPVLKDITITPSWKMGWSNNWINKYSLKDPQKENVGGVNNLTYGLLVSYDLKSALNIPDKYCGSLYLNGFLNYSQAIARQFLNDEIYGGVSVGYGW
ncbi:MAG: hypothetical protein LLG01_13515 [Planctomycetaceae bacterium]|nr:hypothetical protein [Planctomycetaceae bacterium]